MNNIFAANLNVVCHIGTFFSIKKGATWKIGTNIFAQNKFYYIKSGRCTITICGIKYEGIPGRWFFIPAGAPHSYENDDTKPFSKHWMHFDVYPGDMNFFAGMDMPYYVDVPKGSRVDKLFKVHEIAEIDKTVDVFRAKAALLELIAEYVSLALPESKIQMAQDNMVRKVDEFVESNLERSISVDELARICHLHPNHFIRVFKKKTGETPARYIQIRKMETAKRLIEETSLPISEIMSRVGIIDAAQFSKKFRAFYGNAPRAYRKSIQEMNAIFRK